jgi:hypothetical protein
VLRGLDFIEGHMNSGCEEGLRLRRRFESELKEWGWFDAYERAVEIMPVGLPKVHEFERQVKNAESALVKARYAYTEHMAHCSLRVAGRWSYRTQ